MLTTLRSHSPWSTSLGAPGATPRRRRSPHGGRLARLALVLPLAALVAGCTATGEVDDSVANSYLVINGIDTSVNADNHAFGDVITRGTIFDDVIEVEFSAHLKGPVTTNPLVTTPEFQDIVLDRYEVTFQRTDGGNAAPPGFQRGIGGRVRITEAGADELKSTVIGLVIVPSTIKGQIPISYLITPGSEPDTNFTSIQVNARIQFFGRTLAGDAVTVVGNVGINFADFGDPTGEEG